MSNNETNPLREKFETETGITWINSQGEPDIDYVGWLERKVQSQSLPAVEQPEGKTLEEPFGYVFENRFYKNLDQMSGQTFSEGNEPLAVYANQPCKESKFSPDDVFREH